MRPPSSSVRVLLAKVTTCQQKFAPIIIRRVHHVAEIRWTDRVRNKVLHTVKEINILYTRKRRKNNWIVHILRRKCLLKHVTEGKIEGSIEVVGGQGIRCKQLLDDQRKREDTRNSKRKHQIALCGELSL